MAAISKMGLCLGQEVRIVPYEEAVEIEKEFAKGQYHTSEGYVFGVDKESWERVRAREILTVSYIINTYKNFSTMHLTNEPWCWPEWALVPVDGSIDRELIRCQFDDQ